MSTTVEDIKALIEEQAAKRSAEIKAIQKQVDNIEAKAGRPAAGGNGSEMESARTSEQWIDTKSGEALPVLRHGESLAAMERKRLTGATGSAPTVPSLGRLLRGIVLGGAAKDAGELIEERKALGISSDPSGGYSVAGILSAEWIDALRAKMVLSQAGARTLPMDAPSVSIARVTGDPTISWHGENAAITATEPTFGALNLNAKTCVCVVKLSLELSQDSANIEEILRTTIVNAMAGAIDSAGLVGVTTDVGAAPGGLFDLTGRNSVTSIGAPTSWDFLVDGMYELMVDNVPQESIGAFVAHPAVWKKMRKLKTGISSDNTPLAMPEEIAKLPKLWTTAAPLTGGTTAKGMVANWNDLLFGVRKSITVQAVPQAFLASNLQVAIVAYARVDFGAARSASFCSLEGITV